MALKPTVLTKIPKPVIKAGISVVDKKPKVISKGPKAAINPPIITITFLVSGDNSEKRLPNSIRFLLIFCTIGKKTFVTVFPTPTSELRTLLIATLNLKSAVSAAILNALSWRKSLEFL